MAVGVCTRITDGANDCPRETCGLKDGQMCNFLLLQLNVDFNVLLAVVAWVVEVS